MTLKAQAVTGIKWTSIAQFGQQVVQFATSIVLARLLAPSDFGLVAMAFVVIGFLSLFKDLGTSAAVIQHRGPSEALLSSVFWINALTGLLGMMAVLSTAPLVGAFYREPRAIPILRALSVTFFVSGLSILQKALLERNLEFSTLAKIETGSMLTGSVVGIGSALLGAGVWSLVFKAITDAVMSTASLWIFAGYRPQPSFHWGELKAVSSYSLNLTGFTIMNYFARHADSLLIGRFLGAQNLGYYTLAYRTMLYPLQNISHVIGRVMFPVYSQMQEENERFGRTYLTVASAIAFFSFPLMLGLMGLSEPLVLTLFGPKWKPAVLLLTILAPVGMVQSILTTVGGIYQAKGRTDWLLRWGVGAGLLIVIAFVVGLRWGIVGVAVGYAIANLLLLYPGFAIPLRLIDLKVHHLVASLMRPFVCALFMFLFLVTLRVALPAHLAPGWVLLVCIPAGSAVYLLSSWLINRRTMEQILSMSGMNPRVLFEKKVKAACESLRDRV